MLNTTHAQRKATLRAINRRTASPVSTALARCLLASIHEEVKPELDRMRASRDWIDGLRNVDQQGWVAAGHLGKYESSATYCLHSPNDQDSGGGIGGEISVESLAAHS